MPRPEDVRSPVTLAFYCLAMIVTAILNSLSYKKMLNAYKSQEPEKHPHNYEFFVNEVNVAMYFALASVIVMYKRNYTGLSGRHWYNKQRFYGVQFVNMGFLDSFAGFLSCVGGAFVGGAIQSLINQCIIPLTLILSKVFLQARYTMRQNIGALIIVAGAVISVMPSILNSGGASSRTATTVSGVVVFLLSIVPGGFSNVYKEYAFKTSEHSVDIYYMTTWVTLFQVLTGLLFMPAQAIPALGGIPLNEMGENLVDGNKCMWGENPKKGDDCQGAGMILLVYVAINFLYNIFSLLVVKHGSASLSVIAAAVALPLTNMSFSWKELMGRDYEPFDYLNLVSTGVVLIGFLIYSRGGTDDDDELAALWTPRQTKKEQVIKGKVLGLAAAGGSTIYLRPRSDSDPTTPGYTPIITSKEQKMYGAVKGWSKSSRKGVTAPAVNIGETIPLISESNPEDFEPSSV